MSSPRQLFKFWRPSIDQHSPQTDTRQANGRLWASRSMTDDYPACTPFTFSSIFPPLGTPTNMSQSEQQTMSIIRPAPFQRSPVSTTDDAQTIFRKFHHHSLSDSATATDSNDSSPTTTISTVDDSSATETSPGSSPESPPPSTFAPSMSRPGSGEGTAHIFDLQKQPPPKKGRNLKGLAVNTARHPRAASTTCLPLNPMPRDDLAAIASPSFVKPPSPPKRKAANPGLTLLTPASIKAPLQEIRLSIPPTPGFGRPGMLRHFQSSPILPHVPMLAPHHPPRSKRFHIPTALHTILSPTETFQQPSAREEGDADLDVPLSKEGKEKAYPDGPICVFDPYIDLYLEPTAEQARQYDVIMNVASEVRNPLEGDVVVAPEEPKIRIDGGGGIQYAPKRAQLTTLSAGVDHSHRDSSPTTPKATPLNSTFPKDHAPEKDPEYIHIPWEHNSDIVPDLFRLVKVIDEKVLEKKRILVHCQCGVSRSASLVVAYGLYKEPTLSVQEAYDAVKRKSKWIGPNMNLIMQLQEFRTSLTRGGILSSNRGLSPVTPSSALGEWRSPFSAHPSSQLPVMPLMSARLESMAHQPTQDSGTISAGPSSAPSRFIWPTNADVPPPALPRPRAVSAMKPPSTYGVPSGSPVPILKVFEPDVGQAKLSQLSISESPSTAKPEVTLTSSVTSPRSADFAMSPLQPSPDFDPADEFGLMSPSSTEFASSPFDRTSLLAALGMGSMREHDEVPRRSASLRANSAHQQSSRNLAAPPPPKLRSKVSSPTIREQRQLQSLQAKIEANLPRRNALLTWSTGGVDEALMSPRATEFTKNPFALGLSIPEGGAKQDAAAAAQSPDADPRSPVQTGSSPITRSILDVL